MRRLLREYRWLFGAGLLTVFTAICIFAIGGIGLALADEITEEQLSDLQLKVESTAAEYKEAVANVERLESQAAENAELLEQLSSDLPLQEERFAAAVRHMYVYQMDTSFVLSFIISSDNFKDLINTVEYISRLQEESFRVMKETAAYKAQVEDLGESIAADLAMAQAERDRAEAAMEEAKLARQEAMEEAARQAAAEEAARLAAEEAARKKANEEQQAALRESPVSTDDVDWSLSRSDFIAVWQPRIDAYLSGSALDGYGYEFAAAAWDYGVDPRWSPAISFVESTKGKNCFKPYNAWGWGSKSWSSWEEAIDAHVNGLHRIYGVTLTYSAAQKYCPPSADSWYNKVLAQMKKI